ncbi:hypothetical protein, partial [Candidatus Cardinium hertigii]|uniref:hypothetical protein n=1 Tax=Candidatus Cardinium hertigii TaxID=247481 RepID=UPI001FA9B47A
RSPHQSNHLLLFIATVDSRHVPSINSLRSSVQEVFALFFIYPYSLQPPSFRFSASLASFRGDSQWGSKRNDG